MECEVFEQKVLKEEVLEGEDPRSLPALKVIGPAVLFLNSCFISSPWS